MWIFTKTGFYSVVNHRDHPDCYLVRARTREDLVDLIEKTSWVMPDPSHIEEAPTADYRWRLVVTKQQFRRVMDEQLENLDYTTNVKHVIDKGDDVRHEALMDVWVAMMTLQRGRTPTPTPWPYGPFDDDA